MTTRVTIQQFRAALSARADPDGFARAYRELARRPHLPAGARFAEWAVWPPAAAPVPTA